MTGPRKRTEQPLESEHRKMFRQFERSRRKEAEAHAQADACLRNLRTAQHRASQRLGVDVPADVLLLDMLELIEVESDGCWRWCGNTNNHGTPTVRYYNGVRPGTERSVPRVLGEGFGLIDPDWEGILYPLDVNPWHREKREYPEGKYRGNASRYGFGQAS